jgi:hypothetical protein
LISNDEALTLSEASKYTGLSVPSLRRMINGGRLSSAHMVDSKTGQAWVIQKVELERLKAKKRQCDQPHEKVDQRNDNDQSIPLTYFEERRHEWESERRRLMDDMISLRTGIEMYRYKFEEAERQIRLLPAPPEVVSSKLQELEQKEAALAQAQRILEQAQEVKERYKASLIELKQKLQEEEKAKVDLQGQWELAQAELKRSWWKKLIGLK